LGFTFTTTLRYGGEDAVNHYSQVRRRNWGSPPLSDKEERLGFTTTLR
jgi:hypothetical protein